jgi:hypothetical protein
MDSQLLVDHTQELRLKDELALLVLLARLVRLVVLPADRLVALLARYVAHDVAPRRHVALAGLPLLDVDDAVEEVRFAMLAAEVLGAGTESVGAGGKRSGRLTLLMMSSWLARCVLHCLQP